MKGNVKNLDVDKIQDEAINLQSQHDEASLTSRLGSVLPSNSISLLEGFRSHTQKQLPYDERKFLPPPANVTAPQELGEKSR